MEIDEVSTSESESDEMTMTDRSDSGEGVAGLLFVGCVWVVNWAGGLDDVECLVGLAEVKGNFGRPEPTPELRANRGVRTFEKSTSGGALAAEGGSLHGVEIGSGRFSADGVSGGFQDPDQEG